MEEYQFFRCITRKTKSIAQVKHNSILYLRQVSWWS